MESLRRPGGRAGASPGKYCIPRLYLVVHNWYDPAEQKWMNDSGLMVSFCWKWSMNIVSGVDYGRCVPCRSRGFGSLR